MSCLLLTRWLTSSKKTGACAHAQCPTLCNTMDCSPPASSVRGIFQARILEWVAISFSKGSSWPRNWTHFSCISCMGRRVVSHCPTWGGRGKKTSLFLYVFPLIRKNAFLRILFLRSHWATKGVRPTPTLFNEKGNFHDLLLLSFHPPRDDHLWFIPWCWHNALNTVGIRVARKKSQWSWSGYLMGQLCPPVNRGCSLEI